MPVTGLKITIQPAQPEHYEDLVALIEESFLEFVAPDYTPRGVKTYLRTVSMAALWKRRQKNHLFIALEETTGEVLGVLEIKPIAHIVTLFVRKDYVLQGIGRQLLIFGICYVRENHPTQLWLSVNASPYAEKFYRRMGFRPDEELVENRGMRTRLMKYTFVPNSVYKPPF